VSQKTERANQIITNAHKKGSVVKKASIHKKMRRGLLATPTTYDHFWQKHGTTRGGGTLLVQNETREEKARGGLTTKNIAKRKGGGGEKEMNRICEKKKHGKNAVLQHH